MSLHIFCVCVGNIGSFVFGADRCDAVVLNWEWFLLRISFWFLLSSFVLVQSDMLVPVF